ncbi:MAG TPA: NAD(P)-dependent oxidoreductase [Chloroflexota bacterium]|nr:NAD(P)-dependent oxidoreductase [Chloroflexota bacterium]HUM69899.1 NAD(P)-dependent oxidoreductase [Chloroflexota bacterium]
MSYLNGALQGKRVLVTGVTGFIGGRLAQRLAAEEGAIVTGTGRNLAKASFLTEAGVTLQSLDLHDEAALHTAVSNQDYIFHTAAWVGGGRMKDDVDEAMAINVTAVETLIRLAHEAGVRRVITVSSIAAYGRPDKLEIDEETSLDTSQADVYGRTKALGDIRAREVGAALGQEVVVVRPALVYGPRSAAWTVSLVKLIQNGTPVLFGDGSGHAWPVYIDNLIDGMLLTAVQPGVTGEAFNFCDTAVTWQTFLGHYGQMCGRKPRRLPLWAARLLAEANSLFNMGLPLNRERLKFLTRRSVYPTHKAETRLGYRARVSLDEGMAQTAVWLQENGAV